MGCFMSHPRDVNSTYCEHLIEAIRFGFRGIYGGSILIVHGVFPFMFKTYGGDILITVSSDIASKRLLTTKTE